MLYKALASYANLYLHGDLQTQNYDFWCNMPLW